MLELEAKFNQELMDFIAKSPSPFHAVQNLSILLESSGFKPLKESESWNLETGSRYYVTRNDSSIIAFVYGGNAETSGFRLVGAHTDSPCLKVKPQPEIKFENYIQLGVEVYGGALLNPWFDRDLSIAGRVTYKTEDGLLTSRLIDFKS
ncbi:MAG: M18 family aminopeptidase, partial [Okeania sp. SIO3B3]|nr:M18 family aminopeptidase [Okeania sp. SIO3B3]